jgi:SRSO17 transposase
MRSRFARTPFWPAHAVKSGGAIPTDAVELLIEWPTDSDAPTQYWIADLRDEHAGLRRLVRLAKGRWRIEQDYRELKDELGLDHYEGRSWPGWHHHVTLASMAYAFLVLETARRKKNARRHPPRDPPRAATAPNSPRTVVSDLSPSVA